MPCCRYGVEVRHLWGMTEISPIGTATGIKGSMRALLSNQDALITAKLKQVRPVDVCVSGGGRGREAVHSASGSELRRGGQKPVAGAHSRTCCTDDAPLVVAATPGHRSAMSTHSHPGLELVAGYIYVSLCCTCVPPCCCAVLLHGPTYARRH